MPRVQLDRCGPGFHSGPELILGRVHKETDLDALLQECLNDGTDPLDLVHHVKTALSRQLLSPLRNQGDLVRLDGEGDLDDWSGE